MNNLIQRLRNRLGDLSLFITRDGAWAKCPHCGSRAVHPYGFAEDGRTQDRTVLTCLDCDGSIPNSV